jgi:uncharacterized membrane protein YhfC
MDLLVVLAFIAVGLLQIAFPIAIGYWLIRKFGAPWKIFLWGALFFVLVQFLHAPLVLGIQTPLVQYLDSALPTKEAAIAVFAIIIGLLAGLFEEIGRFLIFRYFFRRKSFGLKKENAFVFGAGWGGIESALVGVVMFLTMFSYMAAAPLTAQQMQDINASIGGTLTAEQAELVEMQNQALIDMTPLDVVPSLIERLMTFPLQVAFTLMVFSAVVLNRKGLLALAILWHAALDAVAVFLGQTVGVAAAEGAVFVFALVAMFYIWKQWPKKAETKAAKKWSAMG